MAGPGRIFVRMAIIAGIRSACLTVQVWPRNTKTMVSSSVNTHVRARGHMAIDTGGIRTGMVTVFRRGEGCRQVTLLTDIAGRGTRSQGSGVRVVAVAAGYTRVVHATLNE